jgi:DNA-binding CsgD family transcriptional regulator
MFTSNSERLRTKLGDFIEYLHYGGLSTDHALAFMAENTVSFLEPLHLSLHESSAQAPGFKRMGGWGLNENLITPDSEQTIQKLILNAMLNFQLSVKANFKNGAESFEPLESDSLILTALTANGNKSVLMVSKVYPNKDEIFLVKSVGSLISLYCSKKVDANYPVTHTKVEQESPLMPAGQSNHGLTDRQNLILNAILKGYTNRQISQEIDYSESLVRQETILIYKYFNVQGRAELLKINQNENLGK